MGTITTTSNTGPFQYPGNRLVVKQINLARHVCLVEASTANNYLVQKSTDGGVNWSTYQTVVRTNLVDAGEIYSDNQGWLFWVYRVNESSTDKVYIRRLETGPSNKADTGELLVASASNGGVAGAVLTGCAIKSHYNSSTGYHYAVAAVGLTRGANQGVSLVAAQIDVAGNISDSTFRLSGTREWLVAETAGRVGVSMDKEHNGDGFAATSPNLWVTFGRTSLYLVKMPWSGDGWTGSPATTLIRSGLSARDTLPALWDGSRFLMCVPDPTNTSQVLVYERNKANSSTTTRQTPVHTTGVIRQATVAYDTATGNFRVFAVGTSTAVLYFVDYVRGTDLWGAWTAVSGSPAIASSVDNFGVKASTYQDASYGPYYVTGTTPFTLTYTPQSQSYSPNTPTFDSPADGAAVDTAQTLTLDWTFTDSDPGDTQSKFALSRQVGALAIEYFRTSDGTWQSTEQQNTSATTALTLTALQAFSDGLATNASDPNHVYKVKVWDAANNPSGYSAGLSLVPSTLVNPAITAPTAAQVLTGDHVTITWTASEQSKYRITLSQTSPSAFLAYDSGVVTDTTTRSVLVPYTMLNTTGWTLTLNTYNIEGLISTQQTRAFTVSYTPPSTPTLVATAVPASGWIAVVITNPGGGATVSFNDVYRRVSGTTTEVRVGAALAISATCNDWRAVDDVVYEYQIRTTATNGTTANSAWTA